MRIAVCGAQNVGKTTLVNIFKQYWPMYSSPEKTYREVVKEKGIKLNEEGSLESQKVLRDFLTDCALENAGKKQTIHDRCILDNLVYTLWLADKEKLGESHEEVTDFITSSISLVRECMKFYDIIFWIPVDQSIQIVEDGTRSTCPIFREEIDNIFHGVYESYKANKGVLFDKENQPAFIVLEGTTDQRIDYIKQYIDSKGELIETTNSVLGDLESVYDEALLRKQVGLDK